MKFSNVSIAMAVAKAAGVEPTKVLHCDKETENIIAGKIKRLQIEGYYGNMDNFWEDISQLPRLEELYLENMKAESITVPDTVRLNTLSIEKCDYLEKVDISSQNEYLTYITLTHNHKLNECVGDMTTNMDEIRIYDNAFESCPVNLDTAIKTSEMVPIIYLDARDIAMISAEDNEYFKRLNREKPPNAEFITFIDSQAMTSSKNSFETKKHYVDAEMNLNIAERYEAMLSKLSKELNMDGLDDRGKIEAAYKYVVNNIEYDYDALEKRPAKTVGENAHAGYSALINKKAVCEGISKLFVDIMKFNGLDATKVSCVLGDNALYDKYAHISMSPNHAIVRIKSKEGLDLYCDPTNDRDGKHLCNMTWDEAEKKGYEIEPVVKELQKKADHYKNRYDITYYNKAFNIAYEENKQRTMLMKSLREIPDGIEEYISDNLSRNPNMLSIEADGIKCSRADIPGYGATFILSDKKTGIEFGSFNTDSRTMRLDNGRNIKDALKNTIEKSIDRNTEQMLNAVSRCVGIAK